MLDLKAQKAHDLQQDTANARRKRKRDEQKATGKGSTAKMGETKRTKKEVYKEYTVVLVENTPLVDNGRYRKPNADK